MARAGSMNASGPFNFRGCGLTAECLLAREMVRVRFPAAAPIFLQAARQHAAESPKLSLLRAARRQPAIFIWGRGRQEMHLPCKQAYVGALPTDSTISLRGTRLMHRERSHKPFEAGVIPAPATIFKGSDPARGL